MSNRTPVASAPTPSSAKPHERATNSAVHFRRRIRSRQKNNISAYIFEFLDEVGTANDIDGPDAFLFGKGDYGSPHSGIRGVLNNPITRPQRDEVFEKQSRRHRIDCIAACWKSI
jgi:hypothetical protein